MSDSVLFDSAKHNLIMKALQTHDRCRLQVSGSSMLPTLWPGDIVLIESRPPSQRNLSDMVGNILLYERDGRFFLHRLIGLRTNEDFPSEALLITRGDAMPQDDPPVPAGCLLGVLAGVRRGSEWVAVPQRIPTGSRWVAALLSRSSWSVRLLLRVRSWRNAAVGGDAVPEAPAA